jgi:hypothetical protein
MKVGFDIKWSTLIVFYLLGFVFLPFKALSQKANPLPLTASYQDGDINKLKGFNPEWQLDMIEKGHHLQLGFGYNFLFDDWFINRYLVDYFEKPIKKASDYGIPIIIKTSQPEGLLSGEPWINLPRKNNPNVVESDGTVQTRLSPCGPVEHWRTVGEGWVNPPLLTDAGYSKSRDWWSNPVLAQLQKWYPDPPFVIWISNNEASSIDYREIHEDYRFQEAYSNDPAYDTWQFRSEIVGGNTDLTNPGAGGYETGHGYISRYNAMFDGMRDQLDEWSDKVRFVCYKGAPLCFGRWDEWIAYSPHPIPGRFSTTPYIWDGASPSYYVNNWQGNRDYLGCSPQTEAMNLLFQRDYYKEVNPDFWWELSTWFDPEFIEEWKSKGQEMPPERYASYVKWGMWLTRPRTARIFQFSKDSVEYNWKWFKPIVDATDEVHVNPTLRKFWEYSEPVLLTDIPHPWKYNDEHWPELFPYNNERMRWYQLPNDVTYEPVSDDEYSTMREKTFNVWIMANVMGTSPDREWLIYAYTPLEEEMEVTAQLPEYGDVTLTVKRGGTYYLVRESGSNEYIETEPNVRAAELEDIELEWGEQYKFNAIYSSAYKCDITDYSWDFGDGTEGEGITVNHSFAQPGTYEVKLEVTSDNGKTASSTMKVSVGATTEKLPTHNFPNPFNPDKDGNTYIRYSISVAADVTIKIYDTGNNLVKKLIDNEPQELTEGYHDIPWDGKNGQGEVVANGVYFVIVETSAGERGIGKICVLR